MFQPEPRLQTLFLVRHFIMAEDTQTLEQSIVKQVEYYFSPQNLANDTYLVSKMNPQMFVPLEVVAGFKMLRNLTTDIELIKSALKNSNKVQLTKGPEDQDLIRPCLSTSARVTIILRDIPTDVPESEVRKIFEGHEAQSLRPDIGDTWFVGFATEELCLAAYEHCQTQCFRDAPIKARIKSENLLKNYLPAPAPDHHQPPPVFMPPAYGFQNPMQMPYPYMMSNLGRPPMGPGAMYGPMMGMMPPMGDAMQMGDPAAAGRPPLNAKGGKGGKGGYIPGGKGGKGAVGGKGVEGKGGKKGAGPKPQQPVKLTQSDFPPLPSSGPQATSSGYTQSFQRYQKEEIIAILNGLAKSKKGGKPADIPAACTAPEPIYVLELCREAEAETNPARPKTFAEAAISAEDIKKPEKSSRSSRNSRNQDSSRGSHKGRGAGSRNTRPPEAMPKPADGGAEASETAVEKE